MTVDAAGNVVTVDAAGNVVEIDDADGRDDGDAGDDGDIDDSVIVRKFVKVLLDHFFWEMFLNNFGLNAVVCIKKLVCVLEYHHCCQSLATGAVLVL